MQTSIESKRAYQRTLKEYQANNLHLDSIAMASPNFTPQLIHPADNASSLSPHKWDIPYVNDTPYYIQSAIEQSPEVETSEFPTTKSYIGDLVTHG
jgi:hypothetical protein